MTDKLIGLIGRDRKVVTLTPDDPEAKEKRYLIYPVEPEGFKIWIYDANRDWGAQLFPRMEDAERMLNVVAQQMRCKLKSTLLPKLQVVQGGFLGPVPTTPPSTTQSATTAAVKVVAPLQAVKVKVKARREDE